MLKENSSNLKGNDKYYGYCVDLTQRLSEMLNFTYELRPVKDNNFGAKDANGNWNGMVGELVREEADMAVAPLTISSQRERAIEFSMPFMNMGISIMIKKPKKEVSLHK
jgi:ABC-type amino acid transport substrate-binding protein